MQQPREFDACRAALIDFWKAVQDAFNAFHVHTHVTGTTEERLVAVCNNNAAVIACVRALVDTSPHGCEPLGRFPHVRRTNMDQHERWQSLYQNAVLCTAHDMEFCTYSQPTRDWPHVRWFPPRDVLLCTTLGNVTPSGYLEFGARGESVPRNIRVVCAMSDGYGPWAVLSDNRSPLTPENRRRAPKDGFTITQQHGLIVWFATWTRPRFDLSVPIGEEKLVHEWACIPIAF